jgi:quercetin dioxygenase-like cupin family protein
MAWTVETLVARSRFTLLDVRLDAGVVVPPHVARDADLVVQVVEGEVEVGLDGSPARLAAGQGLWLPRGRPRRLRALIAARLLVSAVPGGAEALVGIAADVSIEPDDRAALLAAAGVVRVPRS